MKKPRKRVGNVAIDTVPLPEKPAVKRSRARGSVAIDTVPLPERTARLARRILKLERQMGRIIAAAKSDDDIRTVVAPMRRCSFRPHYRTGMTRNEGAQATCDAIEGFIGCLAGKSANPH